MANFKRYRLILEFDVDVKDLAGYTIGELVCHWREVYLPRRGNGEYITKNIGLVEAKRL